jgi:hypothetical protein
MVTRPYKATFNQYQRTPTVHITDDFTGSYWVEFKRHWFHHRWCVVKWGVDRKGKPRPWTLLAFKCPQKAIKAAIRLSEAQYA